MFRHHPNCDLSLLHSCKKARHHRHCEPQRQEDVGISLQCCYPLASLQLFGVGKHWKIKPNGSEWIVPLCLMENQLIKLTLQHCGCSFTLVTPKTSRLHNDLQHVLLTLWRPAALHDPMNQCYLHQHNCTCASHFITTSLTASKGKVLPTLRHKWRSSQNERFNFACIISCVLPEPLRHRHSNTKFQLL